MDETKRALQRERSRRAAILGRARISMRRSARKGGGIKAEGRTLDLHAEAIARLGYDPEMLYVECGKCGAPVVWDEGRATQLLSQAGIDPLELDPSCILITDACPACGAKDEYAVRIFRISPNPVSVMPPMHGNA